MSNHPNTDLKYNFPRNPSLGNSFRGHFHKIEKEVVLMEGSVKQGLAVSGVQYIIEGLLGLAVQEG